MARLVKLDLDGLRELCSFVLFSDGTAGHVPREIRVSDLTVADCTDVSQATGLGSPCSFVGGTLWLNLDRGYSFTLLRLRNGTRSGRGMEGLFRGPIKPRVKVVTDEEGDQFLV